MGGPVIDSVSDPLRPDTVWVVELSVKLPVKIVSCGWVSGSKKVALTWNWVNTSAGADGAPVPAWLRACTVKV
jgi:hypothetical protein